MSTVAYAVVSWGRATPFGDFNKAYYPAGVLALSEPWRLYECTVSNLCFVNIPIIALLFAPLAALPLHVAQVLFTVLGGVAVFSAVATLLRALSLTGAAAYGYIAVVALNGPLFYSARLGNVTHVLLPLLVAAILALSRGHHGSGAVLLGIVAVLKPPFLLFGGYLVARRHWRGLLFFTVTVGATVLASVAMFGIDLHVEWFRELVGPFFGRPVAAYNAQSLASGLVRVLYPYNLTNWEPLVVAPWFDLARQVTVVTVVGGTLICFVTSGRAQTDSARWHELNAVLMLTLLAAPITWTHYYVVCLIPFAGFVRTFGRATRVERVLFACVLSLVSAPVVLLLPANSLLRALHERVLISHYIAGALLLLVLIVVARWRYVVVFDEDVPFAMAGGGDGARASPREPSCAPYT